MTATRSWAVGGGRCQHLSFIDKNSALWQYVLRPPANRLGSFYVENIDGFMNSNDTEIDYTYKIIP